MQIIENRLNTENDMRPQVILNMPDFEKVYTSKTTTH